MQVRCSVYGSCSTDAIETATHRISRQRVWVQVVHGELAVNGALLFPGDGLAVVETDTLSLQAHADAEALVFDMI